MIFGSGRLFVHPWSARNGTTALGFEYFPSGEVQAFYREVAESFAQKMAVTNQMKNFSNDADGEDHDGSIDALRFNYYSAGHGGG